MEPRRTRTAGGIVLGDGGTVALVRRRNDTAWLLPKGKVGEGETDEEAARREIAEEAGLTDLELLDDLGTYERPRIMADGSDDPDEIKVIHMYLFAAPPHASLAPSHEMEEARWVPFRELASTIAHTRDRAWLATVVRRVQEAIQRD